MKFYNHANFASLKKKSAYLTETSTKLQINDVIDEATTIDKVTLFTRSYARGIHFNIIDEKLLKNGGLCTISTFVPESV